MFQHPEFVMDVSNEERKYESPRFFEHRHGQAALSYVVYKHESAFKLKTMATNGIKTSKRTSSIRSKKM